MNPLKAITIIEDRDEETTEEQELAAWQFLIDSGLVWKLQGWYGRKAQTLIDAGLLSPATIIGDDDESFRSDRNR